MWKLAWRNLWRNRGRTSIMLGAIALSMGLLFVQMGMADDMHAKMEQAAVKTAGGSVLVHGEGYWEAQSSDIVLERPDEVADAARQIQGVETVLERVYITGLLTSPHGSAGARITGIDPDTEAELQDLEPYLVEGTFLDRPSEAAPSGTIERAPLVLGDELVEELEVELGDRVVVTTTDPEGEVTRALFWLTGILDTGVESLDASSAYTTIGAAQRAVSLGDRLTQIALLIESDEMRYEIKDRLVSALASRGDTIEVLTWDEAIPEMVGFIEVDDAYNYLFGVAVFVIVAFGIANTFLMAVMERVRELGLLGAIGLSPGRIAQLVLAETVLLASVAIALGFALGLAGHTYLDTVGLDLRDLYDADLDVSGVTLTDTTIGSELNVAKWSIAAGLVFMLVVISSLYPAWRASRLDPAEAMRTFE